MYELLYMSVSTHEMSKTELDEILDHAKRHNSEVGISGMLLYGDREFIQILEGPKQAVLELYKRIQKDSRHTSVVTIHEGPVRARAFEDWSMGFKLLNTEDRAEMAADLGEDSFGKTPGGMIQTNPNLGKELFLRVRKSLFA